MLFDTGVLKIKPPLKGRDPTKFSGSLIFINFSWNLSLGFLIFIHILAPKITQKYHFFPFLP